MAVALTTPQVIAMSKTVTRRDGRRFLKPGDRLTLCPKTTGFSRGEHPERIVDVEVLSVSVRHVRQAGPRTSHRQGSKGLSG